MNLSRTLYIIESNVPGHGTDWMIADTKRSQREAEDSLTLLRTTYPEVLFRLTAYVPAQPESTDGT